MHRILTLAQSLPSIKTGIIYPTNLDAVKGTLFDNKRIIEPVFFGNSSLIKDLLIQADANPDDYPITHADTSIQAAKQAVMAARNGELLALMKGNLHTDELLKVVLDSECGIRVPHQRITHTCAMFFPEQTLPILVSDAAVNVIPDFTVKKDMIRNSINLANALQLPAPIKVALLSADEQVRVQVPSSIDAHHLQIIDWGNNVIVEGPMALDIAVSKKAAEIKQINNSQVAGNANILIAANIEAANAIVKTMEYFGKAVLSGLLMGAKVPIILTSRADGATSRTISCALACLYANSIK
ncbi:MAG: hypothetical protein RLZZ293_720 [Pseudomonadota bacterium]|jgi:phosphotransacetylase